tara:strand:- start:1199 stop:1480 length:282 start_codon:yes stop_codon:yes gene_type:complete
MYSVPVLSPVNLNPGLFTYNVVSPIVTTVNATSLHSAIKLFAKTYRNMNINSMIIKDQNRHYKTKLRYYTNDGRNKVGINYYPLPLTYVPMIL